LYAADRLPAFAGEDRHVMSTPRAASSPWATIARHPWIVALLLLVLAIVVLLLFWDWNWFKGPIERQVHARTGRSFDIGGDLDVDLGRVTTIRADALRFGNAQWSREPTMASVDRLEFGIEVWPLLRRQVRIPDIHLGRPHLLLEKGPKGVGNWVFGQRSDSQAEFGRLWVDAGRLRFIDATAKTSVDVSIDSTAPGKDDVAPPIDIDGKGRWKGHPFTVRGHAQSPLALKDKGQPYRVDAHAQAGATRAHARGTLLDPLQLRDFNLQLALSGQSLDALYPLLGIAAPPSPPYAFDGRFTRDRQGALTVWHYDGFGGTFGDSDLAGSASFTTGGARPYLRANVVSKRLDFDDLAGFVGKAPQARPGETTNPELAAQAARERADPRVLPDTPYNLAKLRAMDADVRWKAQRIDSPKLPLDDMDAHLKLENGLLQLVPLDFGVAGGDIRSNVRMDARESPIRTRAEASVRALDLGRLMPDAKLAKQAIGRISGTVALAGRGNSIAKMLATSDGDVAIGMGHGRISNLVMELAGLDIQEALKFMIEGDHTVPIRCAFGDFSVAGGVMTSRALAFDTTDTIIVGEGTIDLRDETLALKLRPRPKDRSLFVFRSPLLVDGTFKAPRFHPDLARVGLRGAIALALGSIVPPAALLATLELGPGEDARCGGRYAK
jgi:AsmA family protein